MHWTVAGIAPLVLAIVATGAHGQSPSVSRPVVQPVPAGDSQALNAALGRLAANPRDVEALLDAGAAALSLGDAEAAVGFYTRASQVAPTNFRAKAGLASAHLRVEDPFTAIRLYAEAERLGVLAGDQLADRGLAYDLVGDNATAQRLYRQAGAGTEQALHRLSLSLAISGDKRGSEAALAPLIARQDRIAWRTRAFALAILGEEAQAVSIANAMMPAAMASAITPYFRYMRQLTRAQQAAAANLGHFPRASEIGRDDPRIAQYSPPTVRPRPTGADAGLIPSGEPLGRRARDNQRQSRQERNRQRERPPEPVVAVTTTAPAPLATSAPSVRPATASPPTKPAAPNPGFALTPAPSQASTASRPSTARPVAAAPVAAVSPPVVGPPADTPPQAVPGPSFSLLASDSATPSAPASRPATLEDAFSDFGRPTVSTSPAPGAVDLRRITPTRAAARKPAEPAAAAKPAPPAQPSRIWVQVATGRDKKALAFDWRKMTRQEAALFRGRKSYVSVWGQTNRLLTGPFESEAAANAFIAQLRRTEFDGAFLWTSPAGQVVDQLPGVK